ncbi:MAG TPA: epimerase [Candidatus Eisenbacteria bacterium]|nr:epimerase [Candidatus Eisenbacteria bacterium]
MKLLILGGTLYLGRHTVEAARARGHAVTLFNRGRTNPGLFPDVECLRGDRDGGLEPLAGRTWDAVIDPSGYVPRVVRASCALLRDATPHLTFISSISAYAERTRPGMVEEDALATLPEGASDEVVDGSTYGPLKALCEREVLAAFPGTSAIVRGGLMFGPHDTTERSQYWPLRVAEGGEVLAPGRPERPVQLVDTRDLARWLVHLAETRTSGVFNGTGPASPLPMGQLLETCRAVTGGEARFTWVDDAFLTAQEVGAYSEMPLWVPEENHAFETVSVARAVAAGLTYRPLADTLRDTLAWARTLPPGPRAPKTLGVSIPGGMGREREAELLRAWRERSGEVSELQGGAAR